MKFVKGMDLSTLLELEKCGAKYYVDGTETDILDIMKKYDVDTIRIRLWNDPWSENGESYGAGENDLKTTLAIAKKVTDAGLEIIEARITYLAYAPEIAAVMLQRQQASAIIDARKMIVDGAVGMVEMALERLNENNVVELDEERKAAMVSNLLVVLCGNHDAQPVVNSGSLY